MEEKLLSQENDIRYRPFFKMGKARKHDINLRQTCVDLHMIFHFENILLQNIYILLVHIFTG